MIGLYILSAVPLALFIILLLVMDSFSLTRWSTLLLSIGAGIAMYGLSWLFCRIPAVGENRLLVSVVEELSKGAVLYLLIIRHKVGLLGDATIYGSAIGAGFGLVENIVHLTLHGSTSLWHSIFLGFEAAVMHIGCTSTLAMALIMVHQGKFGATKARKAVGTIAAFAAAILIHYVHLLWPFNPLVLTAILIAYFIYSKYSLFQKNSRFVHEWLDAGINNEISLLGAVKRGEFSGTAAGQYMLTLKQSFDPEVFFDMYCYIQNYLELSIAAKSNLILKEAGMEPIHDTVNQDRLKEMRELRKRIGPTGELALGPIVNRSDVNRWALQNLI